MVPIKDGVRSMRINLLLPAIIIAVALPGTAAYLYYRATKDPTLRPLGVTKEELAATMGDEHVLDIVVQIDWGRDRRSHSPKSDLEGAISRTLSAFAVDHRFRHKDVSGDKVQITYVVAHNRFGPYTPARAAEGVRAAFAAMQIMGPKE